MLKYYETTHYDDAHSFHIEVMFFFHAANYMFAYCLRCISMKSSFHQKNEIILIKRFYKHWQHTHTLNNLIHSTSENIVITHKILETEKVFCGHYYISELILYPNIILRGTLSTFRKLIKDSLITILHIIYRYQKMDIYIYFNV